MALGGLLPHQSRISSAETFLLFVYYHLFIIHFFIILLRHNRQSKQTNQGISSGGSDTDAREADKIEDVPEVPIEKDPLSTPPSPFLSEETYLKCHQENIEEVKYILLS